MPESNAVEINKRHEGRRDVNKLECGVMLGRARPPLLGLLRRGGSLSI